MFFIATKMGPHCKDMQIHGKQRSHKNDSLLEKSIKLWIGMLY